MLLLIDGYNLLHATDLFGTGVAANTLEGSRDALLRFLADRLSESERRRATIVFDAAAAPPGLPTTVPHAGITVRFARDYPDADAMIEALLEELPRGRGVLVVSGDRRVQRAARQRGALWRDAADWYRELRSRPAADDQGLVKPDDPSLGDASYWTNQFADEPTLRALAEDPPASSPPPPPSGAARRRPTQPSEQPPPKRPPRQQPFGEGVFEGFPPGYADDLAERLLEEPADPPSRDHPGNHSPDAPPSAG